MRIWIENPFDNLPMEGFRPQRYWLMAEAFVRAGHEVVLWTSDFNHTTKARRRLVVPFDSVPFGVRLVPTCPYVRNVSLLRMASHFAYAKRWFMMATGANDRPDIIIVSSPPLSTGGVARRLARRFGAKVVMDVMDAWPETFERVAPKWALAPLRTVARANYMGADAITAVADRYIDLVRGYGYRGEAGRFYHGIDMSSATDARVRSRGNGGVLRLAYAGNLGRTYDLATVVRAVAGMPDATLDIAGKGEGESHLKMLVSELGADPRVRFRGYLGGKDLSAMLAKCDAGVIPMDDSSCVGVPYKFCDYAKAGLAIVSSLCGESSKLLAKYDAGVTYRASDAESLAAALRRLDVYKAGINAREMARLELDATTIYDEYVRFVLKIA